MDKDLYNLYNKWAQGVVAKARANLVRGGKGASGYLWNSIDYTISPDGIIEFSYADYGEWVEKGRRPGGKMPPIDKIRQWARIKGLRPFVDKNGKAISEESRAFLIARAIKRDGIRPFPFLTNEVEKAQDELAFQLQLYIEEYIQDSLGSLG